MRPFPLSLRRLALGLASVLLLCAPAPSRAQSDGTIPMRFVEIISPETVQANAVATFRARVNNYASRPVRVQWDFGDGTLSVGTMIAHRYAAPGTYEVTVYGRNPGGIDTASVQVVVDPAPATETDDASVPAVAARADEPSSRSPRRVFPRSVDRSSLFDAGTVRPSDGGYAWLVASDLVRDRAERRMLRFRLEGLRASLYTDTSGPGSPAYRVLVGQFDTPEDALRSRDWLPDDVPSLQLIDLSTLSPSTSE